MGRVFLAGQGLAGDNRQPRVRPVSGEVLATGAISDTSMKSRALVADKLYKLNWLESWVSISEVEA